MARTLPGTVESSISQTSAPRTAVSMSPEDLLTRQLERSSFGATDQLRSQVVAAGGFEAWLDQQLELSPDYKAKYPLGLLGEVEDRLAPLKELKFESKQERASATKTSIETITGRTIYGAAFAEDQLRQRTMTVLGDLLHVTSSSQPELFGICDFDATIRARAFGRFSDLLLATAQHPAMLVYLDQASSRADSGRVPNENYAREVMELHTVGVDGGYDETDVAELAHVLSGWSLDTRSRAFAFRPQWHDLGPFGSKGDILGWRPGPDQVGEAAGVAALEHLAHHEATAKRIAHIFARHFVSESLTPKDELVIEAAEIYKQNDTAIGPVVKHLLTSEQFASKATLMVRRPIDLVAHSLRVSNARVVDGGLSDSLGSLVGLMYVLGQVPYGWPAPNGFPHSSAAWSNAGAMIGRWNAIITLAGSASGAAKATVSNRLGLELDPSALGLSTASELATALCGAEHQLV
ncbi:MAG: DUF1800 domain-containing protein [Acidimicrobiales bacterium]|nr:DUF1800 domain-containing protein [Acidimicrobiales bacterium]